MAPFFVLNEFLDYLSAEKRFSEHTVIAYENDLKQFFEFTEIDSLIKLSEINHQLIIILIRVNGISNYLWFLGFFLI